MAINHANYWPFDDSQSELRFRELMQKLTESQGVAFFGAGTSMPAGFPAWTTFHKEFLAQFGAVPGPILTAPAMLIDFDYHIYRDHEKALGIVKDRFAAPISQIPPVVTVALTARSLRYFFTTNFDEVLFEAATGERVAVYPDFKLMDARFVYLHGRASTAESIHKDLVLGKTGYDLAYSNLIGGPASDRLSSLARLPVIFIGFSMADPAVMNSLYNIATAAKFRSSILSGGVVEEEIVPLNFYVALKAPVSTDGRRTLEKGKFEDQLKVYSVKVIWYQDGGTSDPHRSLLEVIQQIERESRGLTVSERNPEFVERLLDAEELASVASPTNRQAERAKALLESHPRVAAEFFNRVDGLGWFHTLRDAGSLEPKPFVRTRSGGLRAPYWQAATFLQRMAAVEPSEVKDFLLTVQTGNWVAIRQAFTVLQALDDSSGEALGVHFADLAVEMLETDHRLLLELSRTAQKLHLDGKERAALALVHATLMKLSEADLTLSEGGFVLYSEIMAPIMAQSATGLNTLANALEIALARRCETPDQDNVWYSRRSIEPHRMNLSEQTIVDLLIDITRDALLKTDDTQRRSEALVALLQSYWPTKRRLGIAHCFLHREDLPAHEEFIITFENLSNPHLFHELAKLVTDQVHDLSDRSVEILKTFVESLLENETATDRYEYNLWATILPTNLLPEPLDDLEDEDEPERRLFRGLYFSQSYRPTAPLDSVSFAAIAATLSNSELLALVRDPGSAGLVVDWRHDSEAMWGLLAEYAKEQETLGPLLQISWEDLGRNGARSAVETMQIVAKDDVRGWEAVFDWADHTMDEGESSVLWSIGQLVESSSKAAPIELSERIRTLSMRIVEAATSSTALESEVGDYSILSRYLNYPSGKAVQAICELLRREIVEPEGIETTNVHVPDWFTLNILEPMAEDPMALGIDAWTGVGRFYALLLVKDPSSVAFLASHVKSEASGLSETTAAFWSGYLWAPFVSSDALRQLQEAYRSNAPILQHEVTIEEDLKARFFEHLVIGALRDIPRYDDLLMSTLSAEFTPETRGSIAFALGYAVEGLAEEPDTEFNVKANGWLVRYWNAQVDRLGGQDGPQLAKYLRWLRYLSRPPSEISEALKVSLTQVENNFDVEEVFRYLHSYFEEEPTIVLELVARCVEWYRLHGEFWLDNEQVKALLYGTTSLTLEQTVLREVVVGFAELGAISAHDVRQLLTTETSI